MERREAADMTNTDLIARLEAATEGRRDLDAAVALAIKYDSEDAFGRKLCDVIERLGVGAFTDSGWETWRLPRWSSSIDAALTLVPEGCDWDVGHIRANGFVSATVMWQAPAGSRFHEFFDAGPDTTVWWAEKGKGPTPALALCIAALRAREASHD